MKPATEDSIEAATRAVRGGRLAEAEAIVLRLLERNESDARLHHMAGVIAMLHGRAGDAVTSFARAVNRDPALARAHSNLGLARLDAGFGEEGLIDCRRACELDPADPELQFNYAVLLEAGGRLASAEAVYRRVTAMAPGHEKAWINLASVVSALGRAAEARDILERALMAFPQSCGLNRNLAHLDLADGQFAAARERFRHLIGICGQDADATAGLAAALRHAGQYGQAVNVCRNIPHAERDPDVWRQMGMAQMAGGDLQAAIESFEAGVAIRRAPGGAAEVQDQREASVSKLRHDAEQLEYLAARDLLPDACREAAASMRKTLSELPDSLSPGDVFALPFPVRRRLRGCYNRLLHRNQPARLEGGALNSSLDPSAVEADYHNRQPGMTIVDDLLRPAALTALRNFCLESTVWFDYHHPNGYVGAYLEDGFFCPLLMQIAEDLRALMPETIGGLPLRQLWAYKYDSRLEGIETHADFAAVNVNFWITPDEANLDRDRGGMIIWDKEAPASWNFRDYNSSTGIAQTAIDDFLQQSGARPWRVPYRSNRAVIFNSDLFHKTDRIRFRDAYPDRRINITMLFGSRTQQGD